MKQRARHITILQILLFTVLAVITLFPLYAIVLASLKPTTELFRFGLNVRWDLPRMSFDNYVYLFTGQEGYFRWFTNSLFITLIQTTLTLFVSCFVGYGFAMYNFKGKNLIFAGVLIVMMIPLEIILLPLFRLMLGIGLVDTYVGIILPFIAQALPIFFFRQYISGLPHDFLDAGRVDGCSEYGIFFRIMVPLTTPSFAAMGILVGMNSWNGFLWPLIVLRTQSKLTLPLGLASMLSPYGNNYAVLIAGSVFAIIPILTLFFIFQKYFIEGMTAGGVKG
ncbi:MAG: carbohydrate ABC transporter permease [Clostridiales bacterium]|nr:carbohydrate ABC transporter permease [Clostridiales bacterium]